MQCMLMHFSLTFPAANMQSEVNDCSSPPPVGRTEQPVHCGQVSGGPRAGDGGVCSECFSRSRNCIRHVDGSRTIFDEFHTAKESFALTVCSGGGGLCLLDCWRQVVRSGRPQSATTPAPAALYTVFAEEVKLILIIVLDFCS